MNVAGDHISHIFVEKVSLGLGLEMMGAVKGGNSSILRCRSKDGRRIWTQESKAVNLL